MFYTAMIWKLQRTRITTQLQAYTKKYFTAHVLGREILPALHEALLQHVLWEPPALEAFAEYPTLIESSCGRYWELLRKDQSNKSVLQSQSLHIGTDGRCPSHG